MKTRKTLFALLTLLGAIILVACMPAPERVDETALQPPATTAQQEVESIADAVVPPQPPHQKATSQLYARRGFAEAAGVAGLSALRAPREALNREQYAHYLDSPLQQVAAVPVSTFSIDVDTGAYSNVRRMLNAGQLPVRDAVRLEELVNYFNYDYPQPDSRDEPFQVTTEIGPTPWNPQTRLIHIGIKGYDVSRDALPPANLVFLVDVSGSMQSTDKLPLLQASLKLLTRQLRKQDRISLVVYAGASGVVLQPTAGDDKARILAALDGLTAGGRTNGAAGIRLAYQTARSAYIKDGINRVILATDGDFNVGTVNFEALKDLVAAQRQSGISLTTLGFGRGNYNDQLMEQLADTGNGNYAYIDTLNEAQKVLVDEMGSTLQTIASDVKIQLEFNPAVVSEYRLIGYENRILRREDFSNDRVDAGDIGAGHTVTAVYEIALAGSAGERLESLRYTAPAQPATALGDELALLRLRYKLPGASRSRLLEKPLLQRDIQPTLAMTSPRFRFAAAVAGFGQLLRGGQYLENFDYDAVLELARNARGKDHYGYRGEFIQLVNLANSLTVSDVHAAR